MKFGEFYSAQWLRCLGNAVDRQSSAHQPVVELDIDANEERVCVDGIIQRKCLMLDANHHPSSSEALKDECHHHPHIFLSHDIKEGLPDTKICYSQQIRIA
jgi:hypothetical protein